MTFRNSGTDRADHAPAGGHRSTAPATAPAAEGGGPRRAPAADRHGGTAQTTLGRRQMSALPAANRPDPAPPSDARPGLGAAAGGDTGAAARGDATASDDGSAALAGRTGGSADDLDLVALLGSRLCHDLISPLGAIANGVELLTLSGLVAGPEMSLIVESVDNANARIRFFRIAFGAAQPGQMLERREIASVLAGVNTGGRMTVLWQIDGPQPRAEVKLAFLCLQCLELALPWGGRLTVGRGNGGWTVATEEGRLRPLPAQWALFDGTGRSEGDSPPLPADIHFLLARRWAQALGYRLTRKGTKDVIRLGFAPA